MLAVAYNHAGGPPPMPRFRSNLFLALSDDGGGSWHKVAAVESTQTHATQWHYPTLAQVMPSSLYGGGTSFDSQTLVNLNAPLRCGPQAGCRLLVAYSSLHRYTSFGPEDVDDVVGGIHLAELDLLHADMSARTALPVIEW
jgi:hypothetical protein